MDAEKEKIKIEAKELKRLSTGIFAASSIVVLILTFVIIILPFTYRQQKNHIERPIIIQLTEIPPTRPPSPPPRTVAPRQFIPPVRRQPVPAKPAPVPLPETPLPSEEAVEQEIESSQSIPSGQPDISPGPRIEYNVVEERPRAVNRIMPSYPELARRAGIQGTVRLKVLITADGKADSIEVISGPEIFHEAAIKAARDNRYIPAKRNGVPFDSWVIIPFVFSLPN